MYLDKWTFKAKVYLMNVPWDASEVGDDTWLHIKVSNGLVTIFTGSHIYYVLPLTIISLTIWDTRF